MSFFKNQYSKLLLNEKGELSYRKIGIGMASIGSALALGIIPGGQIILAGKIVTTIGIAIAGIGLSDKMDRTEKAKTIIGTINSVTEDVRKELQKK